MDVRKLMSKLYEDGEEDIIKTIIASKSVDKNIILYEACSDGNLELVKFLHKNGCDPTIIFPSGYSSVHKAASEYPDILKYFIEQKVNVKICNSYRYTPLMNAVVRTRYLSVELLAPISDINATDNYGNTVLHILANDFSHNVDQNKKILKVLLDNGADLSIREMNGKIPIDKSTYFKDAVEEYKKYKEWDDKDKEIKKLSAELESKDQHIKKLSDQLGELLEKFDKLQNIIKNAQ